MAGYAFYGRAPVMCGASADLIGHLAAQHRAEQRAERADSLIGEAVDSIMAADDQLDILVALCNAGPRRAVRIERIYNRLTGECSAQTGDEWQRVLYLCDDKHLPMLRQQWRAWSVSELQSYDAVQSEADSIADHEAEQSREDAELYRAGVDA